MELKELIEYFNTSDTIGENAEAIELMRFYSREAQKITMEINTVYHEPYELAQLFSKLIGKPVGEAFGLFPPFYTDFGKNITIGDHVFINAGYKFQNLSLEYNTRLYPRESLIVFDEIQKYPRAREAVKYLVADGRYDYLETGSLISIHENVEGITIPY